jgi:hemolysin III
VLIAGTYTPITLITLQERHTITGWVMFSIVWGLALLGVLFKVAWLGAPRWVSTGLYLLLGWLALLAIGPLITSLPVPALFWLVVGGLAYSVGAVVYARKRPDPFPAVFGYHELWHLFVLAGAASHFVMIAGYVLPA